MDEDLRAEIEAEGHRIAVDAVLKVLLAAEAKRSGSRELFDAARTVVDALLHIPSEPEFASALRLAAEGRLEVIFGLQPGAPDAPSSPRG